MELGGKALMVALGVDDDRGGDTCGCPSELLNMGRINKYRREK